MNTTEPSEDVELIVDYSERFESEIEGGDPTVATLIRIRVDGTYLISPDPSIGVFEFVIQQMNRILAVVPEIIEGTEVTVPWLGQSSDLEFIPWEENVVGVWTGSRDESDNPAVPREGLPVTKAALVREIIDTAEELHTFVGEHNPALLDYSDLQSMEEKIEDTKQLYREEFGEG